MEAHVGEYRDEVEQHTEADAVGGEKLRIFEMPQHLPRRSGKALRANEAFLPRQQEHERAAAWAAARRQRHDAAAPEDETAEHAGNHPAAVSEPTRSRDIDGGD